MIFLLKLKYTKEKCFCIYLVFGETMFHQNCPTLVKLADVGAYPELE